MNTRYMDLDCSARNLFIYDLLPFCLLFLVLKVTIAMVDKLKHSQKEANHKLRILRQKLQRRNETHAFTVVDLVNVDVEGHDIDTDVHVELTLLKERQRVENERLRRLVHGCGKGRPKSPAFEFAARTILATGPMFTFCSRKLVVYLTHKPCTISGCSARAAKDNMLVSAQLFLAEDKFNEFEQEVPSERWFRYQRKGLGYEAWLYAMLRVAKCEEVLQWGFDETSLDGTPTLNQWVLVQEGGESPSVITIECCGLLVGSTSEEIADHIRASWLTGWSFTKTLH